MAVSPAKPVTTQYTKPSTKTDSEISLGEDVALEPYSRSPSPALLASLARYPSPPSTPLARPPSPRLLTSLSPTAFKQIQDDLLTDIKQILGEKKLDIRSKDPKDRPAIARTAVRVLQPILNDQIEQVTSQFIIREDSHPLDMYIRSAYISTLKSYTKLFEIEVACQASTDTTSITQAKTMVNLAYLNWRHLKETLEDLRDDAKVVRTARERKRVVSIGDLIEIFNAYGEEITNAANEFIEYALSGTVSVEKQASVDVMERINQLWAIMVEKKLVEVVLDNLGDSSREGSRE